MDQRIHRVANPVDLFVRNASTGALPLVAVTPTGAAACAVYHKPS